MSDQFLQTTNGNGSGSASLTLTSVTAGSAIVVFAFDGSTGSTATVSDAQGSYGAKAPAAGPDANGVWGEPFVLENANAGTHNITVTTTGGNSTFAVATEVGSSGAGAFSGANSAAQSSPGTGTDAISSGSVTVTGTCTLLAMSTDSAVVNVVDEPAVGTGFTSRASGASAVIGSWTLESKSVAANAAGTFTAILGLSQYITAAVAIKNSGGATFSPGWATGATKTIGGVF